MSGILRFIGALFILVGIVGGIFLETQVNWHDYSRAKAVYKDLPYNEYAQAAYTTQQSSMAVGLGVALGTGIAGVVSGVLCLAFAHVLDYLAGIWGSINEFEKQVQRIAAGRDST